MTDTEDVIAQAMADAGGGVKDVDDNKLSVISTLANKQLTLAARVKDLEERLKQAKQELERVENYELPNALIEIGMREFKLTDGTEVSTKKVYAASIKVENRDEAYGWMIDNGHEALIKTVVGVDVGKGEYEFAQELKQVIAEFVASKEKQVEPVIEQSVHWQTLRAFVKEQIEAEERAINDGKVVPPEEVLPRELLGVHIFEKATVKLPKTKK